MISGGSGTPVCPTTHACIPAAPTDWEGPVARTVSFVDSAVEPDCPAAYPDVATESFTGVLAAPAQCDCSCGPVADADCESTVTLRYHASQSDCTASSPTIVQVNAGVCAPLATTFSGFGYWSVDPVESVGGSCTPSAEVSMEDAVFENRVLACGGAELLGGCAEGNVCAPLPPDDFTAGLCIWQEGDHDCPSTFPEKELTFGSIDDRRGCETCACGEAQGHCDSAFANINHQACVLPLGGSFAANGECGVQLTSNVNWAFANTGDPTAFCAPSEGAPTGEANGEEPVTICCQASAE